MSKKKSRYELAYLLMKAAIDIATSEKSVTDERLIVAEFLTDLAVGLIKTQHT